MPLIRLEAVKDPKSGQFFVEIYHPADAEEPFVTTDPRYLTAAAAENDTIAILAAAANREKPRAAVPPPPARPALAAVDNDVQPPSDTEA